MAELTVQADLSALANIADFLAETLAGCGDELVFAVQLAVDEACSNTILYGYGGEAGTITIACTADDDAVRVTIIDDGVAFDPLTAPPPPLDVPAEERPIGGLGIHFIRTVMDSVTYARKDGKNVLSMEKKRPASP
ncbi:ATP-binding protein [Methanoculleus sp. YWC-01]|jgi:anti-sigma regulatory factor (Ser/Thr protein kinase)|uniref:ATP-binding protein n=1 Tax=Methanoculleus nereidis TaxID=2735141 RepID=A0ABU3YYZ8_9EURY|nr:ATP-binding protein [Methanoculleus sp. YWC-01]MCK9298917.1 ATP-binding protein [Methanoculleus sp.]MDV4341787.1 ATP-binding protein [Methanoculleus sp. YWC-01]